MATASDGVPRDPSEYRPSVHFPERFHDRYEDDYPPRHLDDEIVRGCIERGEVSAADNSPYRRFRETFGGVVYRLVINIDQRKVVTGYPVGINVKQARESGRWSRQQIEDIRQFIEIDPDEY